MKASITAIVVSATAATVASAQRTQHTVPTTPPRTAAIAPAPSPQRSGYSREGSFANGYGQGGYGHGAFRYDVPILLMRDGRVFADFGRGWEQVRRSCAFPTAGYSSEQIVSPSGPRQPVVVQPTVTQPSAPGVQRLPYTPPVPAQQTPSQQMAEQGGRFPQANGFGESCWAMSNGRIIVADP
jgi:hypothetical protein